MPLDGLAAGDLFATPGTPEPLFVPSPPTQAPQEEFAAAARKRLFQTLFADVNVAALEEGLRCSDLAERRQWWRLLLETLGPVPETAGSKTAGGITIVNSVARPTRAAAATTILPAVDRPPRAS